MADDAKELVDGIVALNESAKKLGAIRPYSCMLDGGPCRACREAVEARHNP